MPQQRGSKTRLTNSIIASNPVWSRDGHFVVFRSSTGISWIPADGAGSPQPLTKGGALQVPTAFTPDGARLVYMESTPGGGGGNPIGAGGEWTRRATGWKAGIVRQNVVLLSHSGSFSGWTMACLCRLSGRSLRSVRSGVSRSRHANEVLHRRVSRRERRSNHHSAAHYADGAIGFPDRLLFSRVCGQRGACLVRASPAARSLVDPTGFEPVF